ncbi:MAG: hypothetical protein JNG84_09600 [Archangium sp.]|nr:hypothetical protein [Archangium sp.]
MRVYAAATLDTPVFERWVNEPRCVVEAGKLSEGAYVWHAVPIDGAAGQAGGRMNKLELVYDNSLTTLAIERPRPGERAEGGKLPVRGVAPLGAQLFVNGTLVRVDDKGRFDTSIPATTTAVFRLLGTDGRERYWVRPTRR